VSLPDPFRVAIISDIHYGGPAEMARGHTLLNRIEHPLRRWLLKQQRHWIWLREPWAHNHFLDRFIGETGDAHLVVANGDYSCDSAYVGVMDEPAFQSAAECLQKLRAAFGGRLLTVIGDHELGKMMLGQKAGGLRLTSYARATRELALEPFWQTRAGNYVFIGVTSTLLALALYELEALPEEMGEWRRLREQHLEEVRRAFDAVRAGERILLFCHDPSALPFLWREEGVRSKLRQVERTIVGHLHSKWVLRQARCLSGMPRITFLGHTSRRVSTALREARHWAAFKILLCPSPPGLQLFKDGGYVTARLDPSGQRPAAFEFHPFRWESRKGARTAMSARS
jgi:hypothetical protein